MVVGLYNGFGWLALGRVLGVGTRFGIYEILTAFYKGIISFLCYLFHKAVFLCIKTYFHSPNK